jgi:hypothetical protein
LALLLSARVFSPPALALALKQVKTKISASVERNFCGLVRVFSLVLAWPSF